MHPRLSGLVRLVRDERGVSAILAAFALSAVLGVLAVGLDTSLGLAERARLQATADAAARAALLSLRAGGDPVLAARAIVAESGRTLRDVRVEWPPQSGPAAGDRQAVAVHLASRRRLLLDGLAGFDAGDGAVAARAVARLVAGPPACLLALGPGRAIRETRAGALELAGCTALSTADGLEPGQLAAANPWQALQLAPRPCRPGRLTVREPLRLDPATAPPCDGVLVAGGGHLLVDAGGLLTLPGSVRVAAGGALTTRGTTLALAGGRVRFEPGAGIRLGAPTGGPTAGLALYSPAPGVSALLAGATQRIEGAVVLPAQSITVAGLATATCTRIVAERVDIVAPTRMRAACSAGMGPPIAARRVALVE